MPVIYKIAYQILTALAMMDYLQTKSAHKLTTYPRSNIENIPLNLNSKYIPATKKLATASHTILNKPLEPLAPSILTNRPELANKDKPNKNPQIVTFTSPISDLDAYFNSYGLTTLYPDLKAALNAFYFGMKTNNNANKIPQLSKMFLTVLQQSIKFYTKQNKDNNIKLKSTLSPLLIEKSNNIQGPLTMFDFINLTTLDEQLSICFDNVLLKLHNEIVLKKTNTNDNTIQFLTCINHFLFNSTKSLLLIKNKLTEYYSNILSDTIILLEINKYIKEINEKKQTIKEIKDEYIKYRGTININKKALISSIYDSIPNKTFHLKIIESLNQKIRNTILSSFKNEVGNLNRNIITENYKLKLKESYYLIEAIKITTAQTKRVIDRLEYNYKYSNDKVTEHNTDKTFNDNNKSNITSTNTLSLLENILNKIYDEVKYLFKLYAREIDYKSLKTLLKSFELIQKQQSIRKKELKDNKFKQSNAFKIVKSLAKYL
eukprot:GAHX01004414.1.p1 GENE.GAHX01004414.1~~GAHX01004414.1.p1  ORF type:complete len:489 (+),score=90.67 GAHX01004414.1:57-1523(+)